MCTEHTKDGQVYGCGMTFSRSTSLRRHQRNSCIPLPCNNQRAPEVTTPHDHPQGTPQDQATQENNDSDNNPNSHVSATLTPITNAANLTRTDRTRSDEDTADSPDHGHKPEDEYTSLIESYGFLPKQLNDEFYLPAGSQNWSKTRRSLYNNFVHLYFRRRWSGLWLRQDAYFYLRFCQSMSSFLCSQTLEDDLRFILLFRCLMGLMCAGTFVDFNFALRRRLAPMALITLQVQHLIHQICDFFEDFEHAVFKDDDQVDEQMWTDLLALIEEHDTTWLGPNNHEVNTDVLRHRNPQPDGPAFQDPAFSIDEYHATTIGKAQSRSERLEEENYRLCNSS